MLSRLLAVATLAAALGCAPATGGDEHAETAPPPVGDLGAKPDLLPLLPDDRGEPPAGLVVDDLVVGGGVAAAPGDQLTVHYVGAEWSSGAEFDASWDRGQPFVLELGAGRVIEGWEQGLVGMREGGRRVLVIPAELAYADRGVGDVIGPGATLVFVVDLLDVQAPG